jgi:hypothetical protein
MAGLTDLSVSFEFFKFIVKIMLCIPFETYINSHFSFFFRIFDLLQVAAAEVSFFLPN